MILYPPSLRSPYAGCFEKSNQRSLRDSNGYSRRLIRLEAQGVIEDDFGPYGAMIVLAAKPNQGHVHWMEYIFRLCVLISCREVTVAIAQQPLV